MIVSHLLCDFTFEPGINFHLKLVQMINRISLRINYGQNSLTVFQNNNCIDLMAARIFFVNLKAIATIIMLITINLPSVLTLQKAADIFKIVMCFAIWYHSYNFKNEKNADGEVLLFVKLQA